MRSEKRLGRRLEEAAVGDKCHRRWHLRSGRQEVGHRLVPLEVSLPMHPWAGDPAVGRGNQTNSRQSPTELGAKIRHGFSNAQT